MAKRKTSQPTFEQRMQRLEQIVEQLDRGDVALEEMVTLYEEGMNALRECRMVLDNAEQKITVIQQQGIAPASEDDE